MRYFAIPCAIIMVIYSFYCEYQEKKKIDLGSFGWAILASLVGFMAGAALFLFSGIIFRFTVETEWAVHTDASIIALEDNFTISGHRCLTSGYINETLKYSYVHKQPDGGMRTYSVPASYSTVYYIKDNERPHIQYLYEEFKNKTLKKIYGHGDMSPFSGRKYKIYVPEGTIVEDYNIDLKE